MSLFTRSFRRGTKQLLHYRPSILWPSLETFTINFKSFLYSFHIPSISSLFYYEIASARPHRLGRPGSRRGGGRRGVMCCPGAVPPAVVRSAHTSPAAAPAAHAPDALSLPAVWQTFPFVCAPCTALITLLKAKLDLYGRGRQQEASEWLC